MALAYLLCVAASITILLIALRKHPTPKPTPTPVIPAPARASLPETSDAEVLAILTAVADLAAARLTPAA
ncbi:hypothetical protein [Streptomyces sp. BH104]|uniref:hypothetical protein n=1 Tax=unclassified Streptomyces TaxID=2593676 RepID=UPI003BB6125A